MKESSTPNPSAYILGGLSAEPLLHSLAFFSDSRYLFSASHSGQVKIWDLLLGKDVYTFYYSRKEINALMFLPQQNLLLSSGASREILGYFLEKKTIFLGFSPPLT